MVRAHPIDTFYASINTSKVEQFVSWCGILKNCDYNQGSGRIPISKSRPQPKERRIRSTRHSQTGPLHWSISLVLVSINAQIPPCRGCAFKRRMVMCAFSKLPSWRSDATNCAGMRALPSTDPSMGRLPPMNGFLAFFLHSLVAFANEPT